MCTSLKQRSCRLLVEIEVLPAASNNMSTVSTVLATAVVEAGRMSALCFGDHSLEYRPRQPAGLLALDAILFDQWRQRPRVIEPVRDAARGARLSDRR